jgi:RNA polymerase sigma-70 factor (ECF subfamily)
MADTASQEMMIQHVLPLAIAGDQAALDTLLRYNCDRLTTLTRRMLGDFRRVRRWAETGDVLQNAMLHLVSSLRETKPQTLREFLALAALQIRRELLNLIRKYYGPHGVGANYESADGEKVPGAEEKQDLSHEPCSLAQWSELHQHIGSLPEEEREVVGLLFYQGLSQAEAAGILNISVRTLQRRWHTALCKLHRVWRES